MEQGRRISWAFLPVIATGLLVGSASAAHAVSPDVDVLLDGEIVPDHVLANMRGRFLDGSQLTYFGVGLYSLMIRKDEILSAHLELGVDLTLDGADDVQAQFRPIVSFFHTCATCAEPSVNVALGLNEEDIALLTSVEASDLLLGLSADRFGGTTAEDFALEFGTEGSEVGGPEIGGIGRVQGVGQAIQADGQGHHVAQDIELLIVSEGEQTLLAPSGPVGFPQEANGTINIEFDTGARVSAVIENGRFGIKMALDGGSELSNMIQTGLLAQQARALGDFTTIHNMMVINARHDIIDRFANRSLTGAAIGSLTGISR